jgi:hypothetical protein
MKSHFLIFAKSIFCKVFVVLYGLLMSNSGQAQQVTPFVKGGFGFSDWALSEDSDPATGMIPAFNLGAFAEINVHPSISISSGLQFETKGAQVKFSDSHSPKFSMSYMSIPVLGKLRLTDELSMFAGPRVGFLLSAKEKEDDGYKDDVKRSFKSADFSIEGGLTYKLPTGIEMGVYLSHGLTNVYNAGDTKIHNCGIGINGRYNIPLNNG